MKPLVLVIEGDQGTRKLLGALLSRLELRVDVIATAAEALLLLEHVEYDFVICEQTPVSWSAVTLLTWIETYRASMLDRALVLSSATPAEVAAIHAQWPSVRVVNKPFELTALVEIARSILATETRTSGSPAEVFTRRSVAAGAKAGVIVRHNNGEVVPVLSYGYAQGSIDAFLPISIDAPFPLCVAIRHARPVWLASLTLASAEYPMLVPVWQKNASRALATIPLLDGDQAFGAVGWSFREPRPFTESEQQSLIAIAATVSRALPHDVRRASSSWSSMG
ncbi:MAG TPA: GAF domain-containing protein [Thermoanaerobaculia bacterium]|jgi:GAF domain-containing protein